jgi:hypothetical protein
MRIFPRAQSLPGQGGILHKNAKTDTLLRRKERTKVGVLN